MREECNCRPRDKFAASVNNDSLNPITVNSRRTLCEPEMRSRA